MTMTIPRERTTQMMTMILRKKALLGTIVKIAQIVTALQMRIAQREMTLQRGGCLLLLRGRLWCRVQAV